ncbi:hypothetical protein A3735_27085 [Oleiphilus sp. HI0061]|uniref:hypothetical protein n=1 Tax=Oleiphilus sp. HI0061 TaxID=1822239 RepID=UPI0007CFC643|nr:hypothetical protein [Oleiphilus sp. HI0061]KZY62513.1 hypothetical protein A3735_27180 [Oleiphilus sp. HI0061]KZY62520.1 hypothetical protein A3735_27085 [Oleiphilus sp. HI0061]
MDKKTIKLLFENGVVVSCEITEDPTRHHGYLLQFRQKNGSTVVLSDSRNKSEKWFGKLDTAAKAAREIGFQNFSVYMPSPVGKPVPKPEDFKLGN